MARSGPVLRRTRRRRVLAVALPLVLIGTLLAGCLPEPPPPPPPPLAPPAKLAVTTSPGIFPAFDPSVTDYVARCGDGAPITVSVAAPSGTLVSVDGQPFTSGWVNVTVSRTAGQDFAIVLLQKERPATTHFVRCLPTDFPTWTFTRSGATASELAIVRPLAGFSPSYPIIFDRNGVPVWWGPKQSSFYSKILDNGHVVSVLNSGLEERTLSGALVRSVPTSGGLTDGHDFILLPNGHFVLVANSARAGVDLTAVGGAANTSVLDHTFEEIDPATGTVVWSWDTADHIPVTEMDPQWEAEAITAGAAPYDVYHWNSIEDTGDGYILSFRHLDAVYKIDKATGDIVWKLGGSTTPESLTVVNDPVFTGGSHFGGQHDARLNGGGTVSLYDNGSNLGRAPRAVRYVIDTNAKTATLVETVTDSAVGASFCCGSARKVAAGDWLIGWGGTPNASEIVNGQRRLAYTFPDLILYRMLPVTTGVVSVESLRVAMDAQYPDVGATEAVDPGTPMPFPP